MKRWIGCALLLAPLLLGAADFWDGNAALQRGDAAFEGGAFAASNSFPQDTRILVTNLDTGKSTEATVTRRITSQSDILVLLSPVAAQALGISQGAMASVRVTVISAPEAPRTAQPGEQIYSEDPDVNPGAAYGGPTGPVEPAAAEAPPQEPAAQTDTAQQTDTTVVTPPVEEPGQTAETTPPADTQPPQAVETQPPAQEPPPQATAAEQKQAEDAAIIADAEARAPQKQLFLPPREDPKFAYHPPVAQPTEPAVAQPVQQPATGATITSVTGETTPPAAGQSDNVPLAEAAAPGESRPQEIVGVAAKPPARGGSAVAANGPLPEAPKPPVKPTPAVTHTAQATPEKQPEKQPEKPAVKPLKPQVTPKAPIAAAALPRSDKGTYFLQLAAYGSEKGAQDLAATLTPTYPTLVVSPQGPGTPVYRVVIGPLNRAESGTLLTWFRYRGFPDAFLKVQ
jgi:rare lipoprotein A (peptidoglycan hydrolase)